MAIAEMPPAEIHEPHDEVLFLCQDPEQITPLPEPASSPQRHLDPLERLDDDTRRRVLIARQAVRTMEDPETMFEIRTLRSDYVRAKSEVLNEQRRLVFSVLAEAYARDEQGKVNPWQRKAALGRMEKLYSGTPEAAGNRGLVLGMIAWMSLHGAVPRTRPLEAEPPSPYLEFGVMLREYWFEMANRTHDIPSATMGADEGNG